MKYFRNRAVFGLFVGVLISSSSWAICDYGINTCKAGYVWRAAFAEDYVCVTGEVRAQAAEDNRLATERRSPTGGDYGPNTCKAGFVWREASATDYVCVVGATRAQTRIDNSLAASRRDPQCAVAPVSAIDFEFAQPVDNPPGPKSCQTRTKISSDGSVIGTSQCPLAGVPDKMWDPGQILRVRMTGGTAFVRSKVTQFAEEWTKYANILFQFVDDASPVEIKIGFDKGKGSWSSIGRDALGVLFNFSTMNFGWFDDNTSDTEFSRTILHEFGHALGLIHEHQSPAAGIPWDKEKVYRFFKETQAPPWDRAKVDQNIFERYSVSSTNYSRYDPTSIMQYGYPAELTLNGQGATRNTTLSTTDKQYIARWYPFPGADIGQLRTGDDCDQIDFHVEYGVEHKNSVRFLLRPGTHINWWKAIEVPVASNKYAMLQMKDFSLADRTIDKAALDSSRPIRFHKAKFLGIHTLLGYRWDVISALPGGSRLTLDWVNDACH